MVESAIMLPPPFDISRAAEYRRRALRYEREATKCATRQAREELEEIARSYRALAENEEWLEGCTP
jgi:hypothetical protein